jgi:hypothetical protein
LKDQEEKKKLKENTYNFLKWQKVNQEVQTHKEREIKELEAKRLKEQWEKDAIRENEEIDFKKKINKQVYMDIEDFNKDEEEKRQMRRDLEKQKDKELINSIVDKEKGLDEIDKREKVKNKYIKIVI